MTVEIWWVSGSPYAWWVLLAAEAKELTYQSHLISIAKRENRTPEYLALNPRGRVPLLRDGDFILTESMAIVAYLDTKSARTPLFGTSPRHAARIWESISQITSDVQRASDAFADPILFGRANADDPESIRESAAKLKIELDVFEKRLASNPYLCGATVSAADVGLFPFLLFNVRAAGKEIAKGLDLKLLPLTDHYPRLAAWTKRIEALAGYDKTYPPHWRT